MQRKIINRRGACRGRPPTRGPSRERTGWLEFQIPGSMFRVLESLSDFGALIKRRRWGEPLAVSSQQSAVGSQQSAVSSIYIIPPTGDRGPETVARDWPNCTCSVNPDIARNRHKHRLKTPWKPAEMKQTGRSVPGRDRCIRMPAA